MTLLDVRNLRASFFLDEGELRAVDDVTFQIHEREAVALVGESGCGKTIVAMSIVDLIQPPGRIVSGQILFGGSDLVTANREEMRRVRGGGIGLVFQEPGAALNPVYTIGDQISDVLRLHQNLTKQDARREAVRLLGEVGISEPEKRAKAYPFELSGGMQQRALIAVAIAGRPRLLIADEPTTALDATVQGEILDLLRYLIDEFGMALLLITHDIGVVSEMAERVLVMYTGKIVETAPISALFDNPLHPYSQGLLSSAPRLGVGKNVPLKGIPGAVPDFLDLPPGCSFHTRCARAGGECKVQFPDVTQLNETRSYACYKVDVAQPG